jgi:hypothetical protein
MTIIGRANAEGTQRYMERQRKKCPPAHFREAGDLVASSIGLGTYIGESNEGTNSLVEEAVVDSVQRGVNLIDSAINYRYQHGERSVGKGVQRLVESGEISRDELVICTKGGILPHPHPNRANWFCQHYVEPDKFSICMTDLVAERHCMHPSIFEISLIGAVLTWDSKQSMSSIFTIQKSNSPRLHQIHFIIG